MKKIFILLSLGLIINSVFSQTLKFRFTFDDKLTDQTANEYTLVPGAGNGTTIGATTTVYDTGKYGKAIVLNGTNDYFDLNVAALVTPSSQPTTVCAWIYNTLSNLELSATGYDEEQVVHIKGQRVLLNAIFNDTESNIATWITGSSVRSTAASCIARNEWQHIAITSDPTTKTLTYFVNGVQVGDPVVVATPSWSPAGTGYRIGAHQLGDRSFFHGKLDEVCLFEGALTAAQLTSVMNNNYDITTSSNVVPNEEIRVFPNPAKDVLNLEGVSNVKELVLLTLDGRIALKSERANTLDLAGLTSGNYLLKVENVDGTQGFRKVIVMK